MVKLYTLFKTQGLENHTLFGAHTLLAHLRECPLPLGSRLTWTITIHAIHHLNRKSYTISVMSRWRIVTQARSSLATSSASLTTRSPRAPGWPVPVPCYCNVNKTRPLLEPAWMFLSLITYCQIYSKSMLLGHALAVVLLTLDHIALLALSFAPRGFSPISPVLPLLRKPNQLFQIPIRSGTHGHI